MFPFHTKLPIGMYCFLFGLFCPPFSFEGWLSLVSLVGTTNSTTSVPSVGYLTL